MQNLLQQVLEIAKLAGEEILDVYRGEFAVNIKGDGSPLTLADQRAHNFIAAGLKALTPDIPMLSEESAAEVFAKRLAWERFWLVDPLDGTKEFVNRNGEFTVNIALIDQGVPVLGVVTTPLQGVSHFAARGVGAYRQQGSDYAQGISVRKPEYGKITMLASRSHCAAEVVQFKENVEKEWGKVEIISMGSSLKLCLVAEGNADIYPRFGATSEWDIAAAQCVVEVAGGRVCNLSGNTLQYNKQDILNPWFLVSGHQCAPELTAWTGFCRELTTG